MDLPRGPYPWGKRTVGKEQFGEGCNSRFKGLTDTHYGEDRHFIVGDMGFSKWTLRGTTPPSEKIEAQGTNRLEYKEGKIDRKNSCARKKNETTSRHSKNAHFQQQIRRCIDYCS